jgi:protein CpxP
MPVPMAGGKDQDACIASNIGDRRFRESGRGEHTHKRREIMKRNACRFTYPTTIAVAAAVLLAFFAFAGAAPSLAASHEPGVAKAGMASKTERVEVRIKELHSKLKITPAQEGLWDNVTRAMRDDAVKMEALIKARSENATGRNAVDDLKSYSEITQAHADGLKRFIPAFEPLYASMSDAQKKDADKLFHHQGKGRMKAKAKARTKTETRTETKTVTESK